MPGHEEKERGIAEEKAIMHNKQYSGRQTPRKD
jgi:hypothetical protein